jgi:hypothetical protein
LVRYWSTVNAALERTKEDPHSYREFQINGTDSKYVEAVTSSHKEHLRYSAVLLIYATLEEFLAFLVRDLSQMHNVTIGVIQGYRCEALSSVYSENVFNQL